MADQTQDRDTFNFPQTGPKMTAGTPTAWRTTSSPKDVNLPLSGATPEVQKRAMAQGYRVDDKGQVWRRTTRSGKPIPSKPRDLRRGGR